MHAGKGLDKTWRERRTLPKTETPLHPLSTFQFEQSGNKASQHRIAVRNPIFLSSISVSVRVTGVIRRNMTVDRTPSSGPERETES